MKRKSIGIKLIINLTADPLFIIMKNCRRDSLMVLEFATLYLEDGFYISIKSTVGLSYSSNSTLV